MDVGPHPHIGIATVTYLYEGAITHRDSLGYDQVIRPGDVNWMLAGRGIVHSERTEASVRAQGGTLFGVQAWVALPVTHEQSEPRFKHYPRASLPVVQVDGAELRVIAGTVAECTSPVEHPGDLLFCDARVDEGSTVRIPRLFPELAIYVTSGAVEVGGDRYDVGDLCVFGDTGAIVFRALARSRCLVFGGPPLEPRRHIEWNFVSSQRERIERAKEDWRHGRFEPVPGETGRIPLPD